MSDTSLQTQGSAGNAGRNSKSGSLGDQASSLANEVKEQASHLAEKTTNEVKNHIAGLTEGAKEKLRDTVEQQKTAGAEYVHGVADAIRQAADGFEDRLPQAAGYIRQAAQQVDSLSDALQRRDIGELMNSLQGFARQQPTAFLGATFLAGFAAMRFLKSGMPARSGQEGYAGQQAGGQYRTQGAYSAYGREQDYGRGPDYSRPGDTLGSTSSPSVVPDRSGM